MAVEGKEGVEKESDIECVIVSTCSAARRLPSLVMGVCISRLPSLLVGVCISNVGRLWLCSSVSSAGAATKSGASRVLGETRREDVRMPGLRPRLLRDIRNSFALCWQLGNGVSTKSDSRR